ncbi:MAG: MFS transporter [Ignavibacteriales bacterium]|nr:MFS transporter [Ignavibacteriales bacterium]
MENKIKTPPPSWYRWLILLIISIPMFGNYYIYDSIAPIADLLKKGLNFNDEDIGSLYSVYSIAAIFILIVGGIIIDKIGTKKSIFLFGSICTIAAIITASSSALGIMLTGRVLLGIGAEPLIVAISVALAKWFKGKELGFAFGLNLTLARLGSFAADNSPSWAGGFYTDWHGPLNLAVFISIACIVGAVLYWILESNAQRRYTLGEATQTDKLVLKDIFRFDKSFWLILALCVVFYSAIFPFRSFAIKYFMEGHGASRELAGFLNSALPLSAMIATPLFGLLVDKIGKRASLMMLGSLLLMPVFLILGHTTLPIYIPVIMMGIAFSLIPAIMWPSVAYIVEEKKLGTAYSVMFLIQQIGVALFNYLIGFANDISKAGADNPDGYLLGLYFLSILGILGFIFAYFLRRVDKSPLGHGLEKIIKKD